MNLPAVILTLLIGALPALPASAFPASCRDEASIARIYQNFGTQVEEMTKVQRDLAAKVKGVLAQAGHERGWTEAHRQEVVNAFLTSPEYQSSETLKAPLNSKVQEQQAAMRSAKTMQEAQSACLGIPAALDALKAKFEINKRQYASMLLHVKHAK